MKTKKEILRLVNQALEAQFDIYTWSNMISDIDSLTQDEKDWAFFNITYKAYFL
jgi:hypothetical protein